MSKTRIRIQAAVVVFLLLPAAAGVLAVHASATCERFVRTYITKPVRNRVSKQTAEAWTAWRLAHPNWKPNPNVHRPRYVMNREETIQKVEFACTIPLIPTVSDRLLSKSELEAPPRVIDLSHMNPTPISLPDEIPPEVAEIAPDESWPPIGPYVPPILASSTPGGPVLPGVPPEEPPISGAVPEPSSLVLLGSGLVSMLFLGVKFRRAESSKA
jgi:hypothetical protein